MGYDSVRIANFLCNGNYAISGGTDGCQAVEELAKSKGARMTVKLAVAGAFHTSYMQPAQEQLQYVLLSLPHALCLSSQLHEISTLLACCLLSLPVFIIDSPGSKGGKVMNAHPSEASSTSPLIQL